MPWERTWRSFGSEPTGNPLKTFLSEGKKPPVRAEWQNISLYSPDKLFSTYFRFLNNIRLFSGRTSSPNFIPPAPLGNTFRAMTRQNILQVGSRAHTLHLGMYDYVDTDYRDSITKALDRNV